MILNVTHPEPDLIGSSACETPPDEISREDFRTVIERAIEKVAPHLEPSEIERLRHVAESVDYIAYGAWRIDRFQTKIGCPIVSAKISRHSGAELFAEYYDAFVCDCLSFFGSIPEQGLLRIRD